MKYENSCVPEHGGCSTSIGKDALTNPARITGGEGGLELRGERLGVRGAAVQRGGELLLHGAARALARVARGLGPLFLSLAAAGAS